MSIQELKVLLIEDNPGDAFLMKFYLGESTSPIFHVSHAETVKAGLDLLSKNKFDIILSDMNLPDSFGVDTIKSILGNYPGNLVVVLTGLTDEEVGLETVRFGAQDFLVKGKFDGKVLISSVMFAFERFKLNKQIDKVSKELTEENSRIDAIQKLLKVGYVEFDIASQTIFRSDYMIKLSGGTGNGNKIDTLENTLKIIKEPEKFMDGVRLAIESKTRGEFIYERADTGLAFRITYDYLNGKICGVVEPA